MTTRVAETWEEAHEIVVEQETLPSELLQQSLDLCVLELNDLLLPLIDHAAD